MIEDDATVTINRADLHATDFSDLDSGDTLAPVHPGDVLRYDFLDPMGITAYALAKATGVPANRITGILHGTRAVSAGTALRLAARLGTSAEFWMNLQTSYDLEVARAALKAA